MQTQTFYRKANVTKEEAIASIKRAFPKAKLVDFEQKVAEDVTEAQAARALVGDKIYVASIKRAEFPPKEDEESDSEEAPEPESDSDDSAPEPSESDDEGSDSAEAPPAFGGESAGGEGPEEKLSPEEETVHLLRQILDALKGGGGPDLGPGGPGDELGLPDVGAPEPGLDGGLPPPGGPKPPLPPPIREKKPVGGPSFASFKADADVQYLVREVDADTTVASIKQEADEFWPTHRVAKIQWIGSRADKKAKVILVKR